MTSIPSPAGYVVVVEWTGDVIEKLEAISKKFNDKGPVLRAIGHWAQVQFQKNIIESHSPARVPYPPLKKARRPGHNPSPKPLFDTGAMYDDIGFEENVADSSVIVGSSAAIPYAGFQNDGTSRIPAREFIGVFEGDLPPIVASSARYFMAGDEPLEDFAVAI